MTSIHISREINAPSHLLWEYLSTPSGLSCWQADLVEGDLTSGNFSLRWPQLGARLDLSVSELDVGKRLVLRAGKNVLELSLLDGLVSLTHRGLRADDDLSGFESSWKTALCLLELAATVHPKKPRQVQWLFQPSPGSSEVAHCFFTDPNALGSWLGKSDNGLQGGSDFSIQIYGGRTLSGRVLFAERDVCLQVREWGNGALSLRTLPGPEGKRILALGVSTWETKFATLPTADLEAALHRLSTLLRKGQPRSGSLPTSSP